MKSKEDIHLAIATLTMMTFKSGTAQEKKLARKVTSALCWVMDYPNEFDKFMDKVKQLNPIGAAGISPDELEELIKESVAAVRSQPGGDSFNE